MKKIRIYAIGDFNTGYKIYVNGYYMYSNKCPLYPNPNKKLGIRSLIFLFILADYIKIPFNMSRFRSCIEEIIYKKGGLNG